VRVCPDTNIWIEWTRQTPGTLTFDRLGPATVFLVTVTLQELWAGARSEEEGSFLERLLGVAQRRGRLLNPPGGAWILSGRALAALGQVRRLKPARLRLLKNDTLLAATAFLYDAAVLTRDRSDFDAIAEVLPVRVVTL
jgi:predicted nucleic acid-binding protein